MSLTNKFLKTPPYEVEQVIKRLGANLRIARLRRNLTIAEVAEKIGTGPRPIANAEKGKISTGVGVYMALLWVFDLLKTIDQVADPAKDKEGMARSIFKERKKARKSKELNNDF